MMENFICPDKNLVCFDACIAINISDATPYCPVDRYLLPLSSGETFLKMEAVGSSKTLVPVPRRLVLICTTMSTFPKPKYRMLCRNKFVMDNSLHATKAYQYILTLDQRFSMWGTRTPWGMP
jgi:hypothetical protein